MKNAATRAFLVHLLPLLLFGAACAHHSSGSDGAPEVSPAREVAAPGYRTPPSLHDGWETATPEELGLASEPLEAMTRALRQDEYPNVHAVLVAKGGKLVYEEYFAGQDRRYGPDGERHAVEITFDRDVLHDLRSATKSVTSILLGIARAAGEYPPLDDPLVGLFPEVAAGLDPGKDAIRLEHALTMSAGLEWNETEVPYTEPENDEIQIYYHVDDTAGYVLGQPLVDEPGSVWRYNSGLPILLGFGLTRTTGEPLRDYARRVLFEPLGIASWEWRGPPRFDGAPTPAGNLWLRPRDLLKIGSLVLDGGTWDGQRVVPADWIAQATRPHIEKPDSPVEHGAIVEASLGHGYLWHHDRYRFSDGFDLEVWKASGNGGQRLWVVPGLELVAVHFTGRYNQSDAQWQAERLLLEHVVPWARGRPSLPRLPDARIFQAVEAEAWPDIELSAEERARYVGVYDHEGQRSVIWEEAGRLRANDFAPVEGRPIHLIPLGDDRFAYGRYEDGRLARIYFPDYQIEFEVEGGRAVRYRELHTGGVVIVAPRLQDDAPQVAGPTLTAVPETALVDEPVKIAVTGCEAGQVVVLRAVSFDDDGVRWESRATFEADADGRVEPASLAPRSGTYEGVEPMGLFWSMLSDEGPRNRFAYDELDPVEVVLQVEIDGEVRESRRLTRHRILPSVTRREVRDRGLVGTLFLPEAKRPMGAVLSVGGSSGGLDEGLAAFLASHGFATLALAYFGEESLPGELSEIPLEYFNEVRS